MERENLGMALRLQHSAKEVTIRPRPLSSEDTAEQLLAVMLGQAFDDGMSGVTVAVDTAERACHVTYFASGSSKLEGSWEMVPPPFECYPALLKAALKHVTLEEGAVCLMTGTLSARRGWRKVHVVFSASRLHEFTMTFPEIGAEHCDPGTPQ
jgi:hypothetical protein